MAGTNSSRLRRPKKGRRGGNLPRTHPAKRPPRLVRKPSGNLAGGGRSHKTNPQARSVHPKKANSAEKVGRKNSATSKSRKADNSLPDLTEILHAFVDALALVTVAHRSIAEGDYGPEEYVLRMGVQALDAVYNRFDRAELQITRFREKNAGTARGA